MPNHGQLIILHRARIYFRNEGEINGFLYREKVREIRRLSKEAKKIFIQKINYTGRNFKIQE